MACGAGVEAQAVGGRGAFYRCSAEESGEFGLESFDLWVRRANVRVVGEDPEEAVKGAGCAG